MTQSKHTSGPWKTGSTIGQNKCCAIYASGYHVADITDINNNEGKANAALIAAAPDLLAVCEKLVLQLGEENLIVVGMARAAIAKAKAKGAA